MNVQEISLLLGNFGLPVLLILLATLFFVNNVWPVVKLMMEKNITAMDAMARTMAELTIRFEQLKADSTQNDARILANQDRILSEILAMSRQNSVPDSDRQRHP